VVPQAGKIQGKRVGTSPKEHVFIAVARASGHGVLSCLKKVHCKGRCRKAVVAGHC